MSANFTAQFENVTDIGKSQICSTFPVLVVIILYFFGCFLDSLNTQGILGNRHTYTFTQYPRGICPNAPTAGAFFAIGLTTVQTDERSLGQLLGCVNSHTKNV